MKVYSASARLPGLTACLARAWEETWQTRGILGALVRRDFTLQCRQKVLGFAGAFLHPLLALVSFLFLHSAGVLQVGELPLPYPIFLFAGTFSWGTFALGVQRATSALVSQGELLLRTGLPRITVVLAAYATVLPSLLVQWLCLAALLVGYQVAPSWHFLFYPLLVLPLLLLGLGIALVLAPLAVVVRELPALVATSLNFLLYLTPAIYQGRWEQPFLKAFATWNPLSRLIEFPRDQCLLGIQPDPVGSVASVALSLGVLAFGIRCFYLMQHRIAERL